MTFLRTLYFVLTLSLSAQANQEVCKLLSNSYEPVCLLDQEIHQRIVIMNVTNGHYILSIFNQNTLEVEYRLCSSSGKCHRLSAENYALENLAYNSDQLILKINAIIENNSFSKTNLKDSDLIILNELKSRISVFGLGATVFLNNENMIESPFLIEKNSIFELIKTLFEESLNTL